MSLALIGGIAGGLLAMASAPQDAKEAEATALVFEFPDGARGGIGRIVGTGKSPNEWQPDAMLIIIQGCGAKNARPSKVLTSHRHWIESDSTSKDHELVTCVKRSVGSSFSVFTNSMGQRDDKPFQEFWTPLAMPTSKAN